MAKSDLGALLVDEIGGLADFVHGLSGQAGEDVPFDLRAGKTSGFKAIDSVDQVPVGNFVITGLLPGACGAGGFEAQANHFKVIVMHQLGQLFSDVATMQAVGAMETQGEIESFGFL